MRSRKGKLIIKGTVRVIGQGYVGLPISVAAAMSGFKVIGIDKNKTLVENLNSGKSHIPDISNEALKEIIKSGNYLAKNDIDLLEETSTNIICVPTPLNFQQQPDLNYLLNAVQEISKVLQKNDLIIIESTVAPGTTRNILLSLIEKISGRTQKDFFLAYSPERIDPLNQKWNLANTPKLIAGISQESLDKAEIFYKNFIKNLVLCDSIEIAEAAKVLENAFRLINISFINEMALFCNKIEIDINAVIQAASTKPYGFMPFYSSLGIGGHCIPVDPIYLTTEAKKLGVQTNMIDMAIEINRNYYVNFINRSKKLIGNLKDKKILILGVSYKSNISDVRETPVESLILGLKREGAKVVWHDDLVGDWNEEKSADLHENYDLAIIATPHDYFDLTKLGNVPILNTRESI